MARKKGVPLKREHVYKIKDAKLKQTPERKKQIEDLRNETFRKHRIEKLQEEIGFLEYLISINRRLPMICKKKQLAKKKEQLEKDLANV